MLLSPGEISEYMRYRLEIEHKVNILVPKSDIYSENNLSNRLSSLNNRLSDREQIASKRFLRTANNLHHELYPEMTPKQVSDYKNNFTITINALDRLIGDDSNLIVYTSNVKPIITYSQESSQTPKKDFPLFALFLSPIGLLIQELSSLKLERMISALIGFGVFIFIIWALLVFILPFFIILFPLYSIAFAYYYHSYKKIILITVIISSIYMLFTWQENWYEFELIKYFPSFPKSFKWFLSIDILSGLCALMILTKQYWYVYLHKSPLLKFIKK
jgi:hypothetical protein